MISLAPCSVIVPTRRRPQQLRRCLESVCESDYDHSRLELVVVNDGGRQHDAVEDAVRWARGRVEVVFLETSGLGPAGARNLGARHAGGALLAFTDDDCRVHPDWLARLAGAVERSGGGAGGRTLNGLPGDRWATLSQRIIELVYTHYNDREGDAEFLATNNFAVPADAFRELAGFDERYALGAEDREFCRRWRATGRPLRYEPSALVEHTHPMALSDFLHQHFDYGRGAYRFHRDAANGGDGQVVRSVGFHSSVPRLLKQTTPAEGDRRRALAATAVGLGLWQAANAAGFVWEAATSMAARRR